MDERPVYFMAGRLSDTLPAAAARYRHVLVATNEMLEGRDAVEGERFLAGAIEHGNSVFLDSGIFWLTNQHKRAHNMTMDQALSLHPNEIDGFDKLFDRYVELCRRWGDKVWGYVELDQGGRERKRETRARLEALGLAPIPVYHPLNDGADYLDELMSTYDRICFGNIVQANRHDRTKLLSMLHEAKRRHPDVWVHVLGLTPSTQSIAMPSDSADSSAWVTALRWHRAERSYSMLGRISGFDRHHAYEIGNAEQTADAVEWCVSAYTSHAMNWRAILEHERAALGIDPWEGAA